MNVGFHTRKVTFTWLLLSSGREQLKEAQSRFLQLWAANHSDLCLVSQNPKHLSPPR